mmetsp:Transcript_2146/g.5734  ORF Transcript_2146/g.5734 Transcript_2146/m.5734 type:complete len:80 (+) Transcript_2146:60-299(+)
MCDIILRQILEIPDQRSEIPGIPDPRPVTVGSLEDLMDETGAEGQAATILPVEEKRPKVDYGTGGVSGIHWSPDDELEQ